MSQNLLSNFILVFGLISWSWYLKTIHLCVTPFDPNLKKWLILIPYFETTLGGKVLRLHAYWNAKFKKIGKSLKTEKTENILQILILEILKCDIQIFGKILSGN